MFLEVSQLEVRYAGRAQAAVHGVTLSLKAGDIGVLIGPSGCGKTTLLRAVAGLEPVTGGEIRLTKSVVSSAQLWACMISRPMASSPSKCFGKYMVEPMG